MDYSVLRFSSYKNKIEWCNYLLQRRPDKTPLCLIYNDLKQFLLPLYSLILF